MRSSQDLDALRARLGISASDAPRLEEALTHGSVNQTGGPPRSSNVKLAFLGDAVIELAIRDRMFRDRGGASLGELSMGADDEVRNRRLAEFARAIHLGGYIDLGKGAQNVRDQDRLLATALEAVVGAVFLGKDFQAAARCAMAVLKP